MSVGSRPFAYNPGAPIAGTTQVGNLAVGTPDIGFEATGLTWWNGPGEGSGWLIAQPKPLGQPTPVFGHAMILSTTYKPVDILLTNGNKTAYVTNWGYVQSVLSNTLIDKGDKVMFSLTFTATNPGISTKSWIGVGTRSMNYNGPFDGFPGFDTNSIGFNQAGELWYNNSMVQPGLPGWNSNERIDVAVDHGNNTMWIRVGGNLWNNDPSADPATNQGGVSLNGLTSFYPVLSPGSGTGGNSYGTMALASTPFSPLPVGFQFAGSNESASVGFLRSHVRTDASFVTLVNEKFGQSFTLDAAGVIDAKNWLNTNGYWTNR
jgi:hypothetical protein